MAIIESKRRSPIAICPLCQGKISLERLQPNHALRSQILQFKQNIQMNQNTSPNFTAQPPTNAYQPAGNQLTNAPLAPSPAIAHLPSNLPAGASPLPPPTGAGAMSYPPEARSNQPSKFCLKNKNQNFEQKKRSNFFFIR